MFLNRPSDNSSTEFDEPWIPPLADGSENSQDSNDSTGDDALQLDWQNTANNPERSTNAPLKFGCLDLPPVELFDPLEYSKERSDDETDPEESLTNDETNPKKEKLDEIDPDVDDEVDPDDNFCGSDEPEETSFESGNWRTTRRVSENDEEIEHSLSGKASERWRITRNDRGEVAAVAPQMRRDPNPDREFLRQSRTQLVAQIEASRLSEQDKLALLQNMQRLEQDARDGRMGTIIEPVRASLSSTYMHAQRLLRQGASLAQISAALDPNAASSQVFQDTSGRFLDRSRRGDLDEARVPQMWTGNMTAIADSRIFTASLNGNEVESWRISLDNRGRVRRLDMLRHADPEPDRQGLNEARRELVAAIHGSGMRESEKVEFCRNLAQIEARARAGEMGTDMGRIRQELADTYRAMTRLTSDRSERPVMLAQRLVLVRQLAHQFADTQDIDQGIASDACRISAVECRLSVTRPSVVARVVADAAITGRITIGVGREARTVQLGDESRQPASEICTRVPKPQNERSYASQLFQLAVMNRMGYEPLFVREHIYFSNLDLPEGTARIRDYERLSFAQKREGRRGASTEEFPNGTLTKRDNGMRVLGWNGNSSTLLTNPAVTREGTHQPLFQGCWSQRMLDLLDPGRHTGTVLAHRRLTLYNREDVFEQGLEATRGLVLFDSMEHLERLVRAAQRDGRLPLLITTRDFEADPGEAAPRLRPEESNHIFTIRGYIPAGTGPDGRPTPARFITDDQFGRRYDRRNITLEQLRTMVDYDSRRPARR